MVLTAEMKDYTFLHKDRIIQQNLSLSILRLRDFNIKWRTILTRKDDND